MVTHTLQTERRRKIRADGVLKRRSKASKKRTAKSPTRKILKKLSAATKAKSKSKK